MRPKAPEDVYILQIFAFPRISANDFERKVPAEHCVTEIHIVDNHVIKYSPNLRVPLLLTFFLTKSKF